MVNKKNNNNLFFVIIIVLLVVIAILGFFVWKELGGNNTATSGKKIEITVIDDKRCTDCQTDNLISQLQLLPVLASAEIERKDFNDKWVEEYLKENNINALPAFIFKSNQIDPNINQYLQALPSEEYSLQVWAHFNPFQERSERGFPIVEIEKIQEIKENSYIKGDADAKITWIEYSDLECPFCAKLHNAGTPKDILEKYDEVNLVFNHFPLQFHANALPWAQIAECLAEQKWNESFYSLINTAYTEENSNKSFLIDEAVKLWADESEIKDCLESGKHEDKINKQMATGGSLFGITGTPGNILVNNETGEYQVISWAYPTSSFETAIDQLLENE